MPTKARQNRAAALVLFFTLPLVLLGGVYYYGYRERPHEPVQPVPFSHATHTDAAKAAIPCVACHRGAENAAGAGMPADSSCMQCHLHVLPTDARLAPLHAAANPHAASYTGEALRWVRSAPLPAHVHFHHGQHTRAGITCAQCHPTPDSQLPHSMQSCLDCHRKHALPTDCARCHH
ncbi:MAG: hypothetical protein II349_01195 [Akkermansia sp.]|nr:hypothetical protein [Akkermansia sp.]